MNSKNITATEGRLLSSFGSLTNSVVDTQEITQTIQKTEEKLSLKTGVVTKYYPHLDKAEVIGAINLMRQDGLLSDTKDMSAYIYGSDTENKSKQILKKFAKLEQFLLEQEWVSG